jgi:hypothetical protein
MNVPMPLAEEKVSKNVDILEFSNNCPKYTNCHPTGENSPNLVILLLAYVELLRFPRLIRTYLD